MSLKLDSLVDYISVALQYESVFHHFDIMDHQIIRIRKNKAK